MNTAELYESGIPNFMVYPHAHISIENKSDGFTYFSYETFIRKKTGRNHYYSVVKVTKKIRGKLKKEEYIHLLNYINKLTYRVIINKIDKKHLKNLIKSEYTMTEETRASYQFRPIGEIFIKLINEDESSQSNTNV